MSLRKSLIIIGIVGLAVAAAEASGDLERSFAFPSGGLLQIDTDRGNIEIRTGSSDQIHVRVSATRGDLAEALDVRFEERDGLRIEGRKVRGASDRATVTFEIEAPKWMNLEIDNGGGHVTIEELEGEMRIKTGGGHIKFADVHGPVDIDTGGGHIEGGDVDGGLQVVTGGGHIRVADVFGDLSVRTGGGHISAGNVEGKASARSGGGHVQLGDVAGDIEIETGGGHLNVAACEGDVGAKTGGGEINLARAAGRVLAHTGGGDIRVALADGNGAGVDLESGDDGDIFLRIPAGMGYEVQADASGQVRVSVPFEGKRRTDRLDGVISGGGNLLRIRAHGGDVSIDTR